MGTAVVIRVLTINIIIRKNDIKLLNIKPQRCENKTTLDSRFLNVLET